MPSWKDKLYQAEPVAAGADDALAAWKAELYGKEQLAAAAAAATAAAAKAAEVEEEGGDEELLKSSNKRGSSKNRQGDKEERSSGRSGKTVEASQPSKSFQKLAERDEYSMGAVPDETRTSKSKTARFADAVDLVAAATGKDTAAKSFGSSKKSSKSALKLSSKDLPPSKPPAKAKTPSKTHSMLQNKNKSMLQFQIDTSDFEVFPFMDEHCHGLSERGMEGMSAELAVLRDHANQEIQACVYENHRQFLEASRAIPELDERVQELRGLLTGASAAVEQLKKVQGLTAQAPPIVATSGSFTVSGSFTRSSSRPPLKAGANTLGPGLKPGNTQPISAAASSLGGHAGRGGSPELETVMLELFTDLKVAVAERDFDQAQALLGAGYAALEVLKRDAAVVALEVTYFPEWLRYLEVRLGESKQRLVEELGAVLEETRSSPPELRSAAAALSRLVGGPTAAHRLLACHTIKAERAQQQLLKYHSSVAGLDEDSLEYAGSLAQRTFLQVGLASDDMVAVFGGSNSPATASIFTQWAAKEAGRCSLQLCQQVLAPFGDASSLRGPVSCAHIAASFCASLEYSHGLYLMPEFMPQVVRYLDGVIRLKLEHTADVAASAAFKEVRSQPQLLQVAPPSSSDEHSPAGAQRNEAGGSAASMSAIAGLPVPTPSTSASRPSATPPLPASASTSSSRFYAAPPRPAASSMASGAVVSVMLVASAAMLEEIRDLSNDLVPLAGPRFVPTLINGVYEVCAALSHAVVAAVQDALSSAPLGASVQLRPFISGLHVHLTHVFEEGLPKALLPLVRCSGHLLQTEKLTALAEDVAHLEDRLASGSAASSSHPARLYSQPSISWLQQVSVSELAVGRVTTAGADLSAGQPMGRAAIAQRARASTELSTPTASAAVNGTEQGSPLGAAARPGRRERHDAEAADNSVNGTEQASPLGISGRPGWMGRHDGEAAKVKPSLNREEQASPQGVGARPGRMGRHDTEAAEAKVGMGSHRADRVATTALSDSDDEGIVIPQRFRKGSKAAAGDAVEGSGSTAARPVSLGPSQAAPTANGVGTPSYEPGRRQGGPGSAGGSVVMDRQDRRRVVHTQVEGDDAAEGGEFRRVTMDSANVRQGHIHANEDVGGAGDVRRGPIHANGDRAGEAANVLRGQANANGGADDRRAKMRAAQQRAKGVGSDVDSVEEDFKPQRRRAPEADSHPAVSDPVSGTSRERRSAMAAAAAAASNDDADGIPHVAVRPRAAAALSSLNLEPHRATAAFASAATAGSDGESAAPVPIRATGTAAQARRAAFASASAAMSDDEDAPLVPVRLNASAAAQARRAALASTVAVGFDDEGAPHVPARLKACPAQARKAAVASAAAAGSGDEGAAHVPARLKASAAQAQKTALASVAAVGSDAEDAAQVPARLKVNAAQARRAALLSAAAAGSDSKDAAPVPVRPRASAAQARLAALASAAAAGSGDEEPTPVQVRPRASAVQARRAALLSAAAAGSDEDVAPPASWRRPRPAASNSDAASISKFDDFG